jgi:hypothetical protein
VSVLQKAGIAAVLAAGDRVEFDCDTDATGRLRVIKLALEAAPRPAAVD